VAGEIIELPVKMEGQKRELILKIRPDSYQALFDQQQAAISTAESVSGQQKASMEKAAQDLKKRGSFQKAHL
jgi:multidrug resistance efflux pump